jgi:hypothetical protein
MTDQEVRIFNVLYRQGLKKGFHMESTSMFEPATQPRKFTFTNGSDVRIVPLFEEDLTKAALDGVLSDDVVRKIDGELD